MNNVQAEALLLKYQKEMSEWEEYRKALDEKKCDVFKIKKMAQDVCIHPQTRREAWYNGHNGTTDVDVICLVCDKTVQTY